MNLENDETSLTKLSFVQFINIFSLMVVAGSVSTAFFFVRYFKADMPYSFYWVLASGVWIIYTIDHLRDGARLKENASFLRHAVHYRYRHFILPSLAAVGLFDAVLILFFFDKSMIINGLVMGGFVMIYFVMFYLFKLPLATWLKEVFVAIMVVAGMVIYPGLAGNLSWAAGEVLIICIFLVLNYINLMIFTYFDFEGDIRNDVQSIATVLGKEKTLLWIYQLLALCFTFLVFYAFFVPNALKISATVTILCMLNLNLALVIFEEKSALNGTYRFWGDFAYLIPGLIWLFLGQESFF